LIERIGIVAQYSVSACHRHFSDQIDPRFSTADCAVRALHLVRASQTPGIPFLAIPIVKNECTNQISRRRRETHIDLYRFLASIARGDGDHSVAHLKTIKSASRY
jgi:hypothetical protein